MHSVCTVHVHSVCAYALSFCVRLLLINTSTLLQSTHTCSALVSERKFFAHFHPHHSHTHTRTVDQFYYHFCCLLSIFLVAGDSMLHPSHTCVTSRSAMSPTNDNVLFCITYAVETQSRNIYTHFPQATVQSFAIFMTQ